MSKTTSTYLCIRTFVFRKSACDSSLKGKIAFTEGKTYEGIPDRLWSADSGAVELTDDTGRTHTITSNIFSTIFTECK